MYRGLLHDTQGGMGGHMQNSWRMRLPFFCLMLVNQIVYHTHMAAFHKNNATHGSAGLQG